MDILVEKGLDQAQFNQSITQENLEIGKGLDDKVETMNRMSSFLFHHSERINRETTLTASYLHWVQQPQQGVLLLHKAVSATYCSYLKGLPSVSII
mgnify:CR=1 FL=1